MFVRIICGQDRIEHILYLVFLKPLHRRVVEAGCDESRLVASAFHFCEQLTHSREQIYQFAEVVAVKASVDFKRFLRRHFREEFFHRQLERLAECLHYYFPVFLSAPESLERVLPGHQDHVVRIHDSAVKIKKHCIYLVHQSCPPSSDII